MSYLLTYQSWTYQITRRPGIVKHKNTPGASPGAEPCRRSGRPGEAMARMRIPLGTPVFRFNTIISVYDSYEDSPSILIGDTKYSSNKTEKRVFIMRNE